MHHILASKYRRMSRRLSGKPTMVLPTKSKTRLHAEEAWDKAKGFPSEFKRDSLRFVDSLKRRKGYERM